MVRRDTAATALVSHKVTDLVLDEILDNDDEKINHLDLRITLAKQNKLTISSMSSKRVTKRVRTAVRRPKLNEADLMLKLAHETGRDDSPEAETAATSKGHHKGKSTEPMSFWTSD